MITPLAAAARAGHAEAVKLLLRLGARPALYDHAGALPVRSWAGLTLPLAWAAEAGCAEAVDALLRAAGAARLQHVNHQDFGAGSSALILAAKGGHEPAAALLLDSGAEIDARDGAGCSALWWAAYHGNAGVLRLLLRRGADPELAQSSRLTSHTALALRASPGWAPLHAAVARFGRPGRRVEVVRALLTAGAEVNAADADGETPLHRAVGHVELVRALVEAGADVNAGAAAGLTPLHVAVYQGCDRSLELLLNAGADIEAPCTVMNVVRGDGQMESVDCFGARPLALAADQGELGALKALLDRGADVNTRDDIGRTALWCAASFGGGGTVEVLLRQPGIELEYMPFVGRKPVLGARWQQL